MTTAIPVASRWRPGPARIGLALTLLAVAGAEGAALATSWGAWYWLFDVAVASALTALAVAWALRPTVAATAGLVVAALAVVVGRLAGLPSQPGLAAALALAALTVPVVRRSAPATAGAVAAGWLALMVVAQLVRAPDSGLGGVTVLNGLCCLAAVAAGLGLRFRDDGARAIRARIRQEERLQLARELHDVVAHHVTGLVIQSQAAQVVVRRRPDGVADALAGMEAMATEALEAIRRAVGVLRSDDDDGAPLTAQPETVRGLVGRFERQGPSVRLQAGEPDERWSAETTVTVHRIVQESLTNVLHHATGASSVAVTVTDDGHEVAVTVEDDGRPQPGSPLSRRQGYGLMGMAERVELLGGRLAAGPVADGAGWRVEATLPLAPPGRPEMQG